MFTRMVSYVLVLECFVQGCKSAEVSSSLETSKKNAGTINGVAKLLVKRAILTDPDHGEGRYAPFQFFQNGEPLKGDFMTIAPEGEFCSVSGGLFSSNTYYRNVDTVWDHKSSLVLTYEKTGPDFVVIANEYRKLLKITCTTDGPSPLTSVRKAFGKWLEFKD